MSLHVVKPPTVHWLVLAEEISAIAAVNAMPSWTGKTSTLYMLKYALYAGICIRINMPLFAN